MSASLGSINGVTSIDHVSIATVARASASLIIAAETAFAAAVADDTECRDVLFLLLADVDTTF